MKAAALAPYKSMRDEYILSRIRKIKEINESSILALSYQETSEKQATI